MKVLSQAAHHAFQSVALPLTLIVVWWVASGDSTSVYFPPLRDIIQAFWDNWVFERFRSDVEPSLIRFAMGLAIAIVAGVAAGVVLGLSPRARRDLLPVTEFLRATPFAALVPVALVLLGPGANMEISLIAFASWWPVLVSTADGVRGVDPLLVESARVYSVSRSRLIFRVILPAALPRIFAGIRIAVAIAVAATVIANMYASNAGLGFFVIDAQSRFDVRDTWSGVLMIGLVGLVANLAFLSVQRRALAWHSGWRSAGERI
jgi:ABC-type nitrate/sulfonate/bicarbonate transport system permease component